MTATPTPTEPAGRVYGGMSDAQRREDRRNRLLEAGLSLYGTQGFAPTTIDQLCREAKITARHFYESFATQQELFEAVYDTVFATTNTAVAEAIDAGEQTPDAMIRTAITTLFRSLFDDPRKGRLVCAEVYVAPHGIELGNAGIRKLTEIVEFYCGLLVELGFMAPGQLHLRAVAITGVLRELIWSGLFEQEAATVDETIETAIEVFTRITSSGNA